MLSYLCGILSYGCVAIRVRRVWVFGRGVVGGGFLVCKKMVWKAYEVKLVFCSCECGVEPSEVLGS